jgi:high-affinity Fe2+/Pb2+ permease
VFIWVEPGWFAKSLMLSAFPAFVLGAVVVHGLGRLGISEVSSFMVLMPLLISAWFYFVGWLVDRWRFKRSERISATVPDGPD